MRNREVYDESEWAPIGTWYVTTWWRSKGLVRKEVYRDHRPDGTVAYRDGKGRLVYTYDAYATEWEAREAVRRDVAREVMRAKGQLALAQARLQRAAEDWQRMVNAGFNE